MIYHLVSYNLQGELMIYHLVSYNFTEFSYERSYERT